MKRFGVILAAGESSRMGVPKALLEWDGSTFAERLARLFREAAEDAVVVLGHDAERIAARLAGVRTVVNHQYRRGMLTSLQCGLRAADAERYLFTLVDLPAVALTTVKAVAEAGGDVVIPRCLGRSGHPVAFSRQVARELLELPETGSARDVLKRDFGRIRYVDVDDPEIARDIDTPDEYRALVERA